MKKIFLINYSLMEKIADKKNGVTTEDASAYITGVELFFLLQIVEFLIIRLLPFKISLPVILAVMSILWYFTHYSMRKVYRKRIIELKIRNIYKGLNKSKRRKYFWASILLFFLNFLVFFIAGAILIGGYTSNKM